MNAAVKAAVLGRCSAGELNIELLARALARGELALVAAELTVAHLQEKQRARGAELERQQARITEGAR